MNLTAEAYDLYYQHGLPEEPALSRYWSAESFNRELAALGVSNPCITERDAAQARFPYMLESRLLHNVLHPPEVGNVQPHPHLLQILEGTPFENWERAAAVMSLAARFHDIAYKNIDADPYGRKAWPQQIVRLINGVADWEVNVIKGERLFETFLTEKGKSHTLTRTVAYLFGLTVDRSINHRTGGSNEFDSALAAVQFLKLHAMKDKDRPIEMLDIVAIASIIAATIPFRPNARADGNGAIQPGFHEKLARRVRTLLLRLGQDPKTATRNTNAISAMGVCVANRDTGAFMRPGNGPGLTHGARLLKTEGLIVDGRYILREPATTMSGLMRTTRLIHFAPGLYTRIINGQMPPGQVASFVVPFDDAGKLRGVEHSYPSQDAHALATSNITENARESNDFFTLHGVGVATGRVLLRLTGELDCEVPGGVNAKVRLPTMEPTGENFANLKAEGGRGWKLYGELGEGASQSTVGRLTTRESPLAALSLGAAGLEGSLQLAAILDRHWKQADARREPDPYLNKGRAIEFRDALLGHVGPSNYNLIVDTLILAADLHNNPERLRELEKLKV